MRTDWTITRRRSLALVGAGLFAIAMIGASNASAQVVRSTPQEAEALIQRAIAHYDEVGEAQAFEDFSNPNGDFIENDLYVIVCTMEGIYKTHAYNAALIDNDVLWDIQDVNGIFPVRRIVTSAQEDPEGGWIDYVWVNPVNEALEEKHVYVVAHAGYAFAVGYYEAN